MTEQRMVTQQSGLFSGAGALEEDELVGIILTFTRAR